jgi:ribonuclease HII
VATIIQRRANAFGLGTVSAAEVDELGLSAAGRLAMRRAAEALGQTPDYLLIDAFRLPELECPQEAIIFGDALCLSIAAASILAKVERDSLLCDMARLYPGYGFERHKGYGTAEHAVALKQLGLTPEHRRSYAPVRAIQEAVAAC